MKKAVSLNPGDNGGQQLIFSIDTEEEGSPLEITACCYGSHVTTVKSYTYTIRGLDDVIRLLTERRAEMTESL